MPKIKSPNTNIGWKRQDWGIDNGEKTITYRDNAINKFCAEVPNFQHFIHKSKYITNTQVAAFIRGVLSEVDGKTKVAVEKELKVKSQIASLVFEPVSIKDDYFDELLSEFNIDRSIPKYLSIAPSLNPQIYNVLQVLFLNRSFLAEQADIDVSVWNKYTRLTLRINRHAWGLLLLSLGLHPIYLLKKREIASKLYNSKIVNVLKDYCGIAVSNSIDDSNDLLYYRQDHTFSSTKKLYVKSGDDFYPHSSSIKSLFDSNMIDVSSILRNSGIDSRTTELSLQQFRVLESEISKFISTNAKKFDKLKPYPKLTWDKAILHCILELDISEDSIEFIKSNLSTKKIAKRLHVSAPNNPNVYTALKAAICGIENERYTLSEFETITGINTSMWVRLEGGSRNLSNTAWSHLLLNLNIHPYYELTVKPPVDIIYDTSVTLYKELHKLVCISVDDELELTLDRFNALSDLW